MELRVQQARAIVHEINTVLPQKINLMNKDGIIIASTDPERIHTFHGGAARVIRENLDELRIYRENEYPGTRPGTNFMLQVEGVPIGVLGITGSYESILPIANVIRKMTELLVHEQEYQRMQTHLQYQRHLFLQELLEHSETFLSKEQIERARLLDIDLGVPRRIVVADLDSPVSPERHNEVFSQLEMEAQRIDAACRAISTNQMIVFLTDIRPQEQLRSFAEKRTPRATDRALPRPRLPRPDNTGLLARHSSRHAALYSCHHRATHIKSYDGDQHGALCRLDPTHSKARICQRFSRLFTGARRCRTHLGMLLRARWVHHPHSRRALHP